MAEAGALTNPALEKMRRGEAALGLSVRIARSGDIARIARASGHDFLFIDTQHAIFNLETIAHIANTALAIGIAPMVRVRGLDDPDVPLLLDSGVTGIIFPDIATAAQARRAVERCKFPPIGKRSVGANFPQFDGRGVPLKEAVPALNGSTVAAVMIETVEGLENAEEIAKVDGLDVIHVGTNDLLVDMGKPGRFDDPAIEAALDRVIKVASAHGKFPGCGGIRDVDRQRDIIRRGARFLTTQSDVGFLHAAARQWIDGVKGRGPAAKA
jgi:2-keto-3-deoxy-L-rhamnonate aldolase RhmA